jgi:hypothetical protein
MSWGSSSDSSNVGCPGRSAQLVVARSDSAPSDLGLSCVASLSFLTIEVAKFRAYDPTTGRWLKRDPIGESGGLNLYGYVTNAPLRQIDRYGLWVWVGAGIGAINGGIGGAISGYSTGGLSIIGGVTGGLVGALAGAGVGIVAPSASSVAGSVVASAVVGAASNITGQVIVSVINGADITISYGTAVGSAIGGVVAQGIGLAVGATVEFLDSSFQFAIITGTLDSVFSMFGWVWDQLHGQKPCSGEPK